MARHLDDIPNLTRAHVSHESVKSAESVLELPLDRARIDEGILAEWWLRCPLWCVDVVLQSADGCPVPGASVTVETVLHAHAGYSVTPQTTGTTDANGKVTLCFPWCSCWICRPCWPCWPIWWDCWPWWWEYDILHVLESVKQRLPTIERSAELVNAATAGSYPLSRPVVRDLVQGRGFAAATVGVSELVRDEQRTQGIRRAFSDPRLREIFPWWWWCCDDPNVIFKATQNGNTIVSEVPAFDTRWCFEDGQTVTLVANSKAISACGGDPKPVSGFVWTRVGNTTVDQIHGGYADGSAGSDASDMAFTGALQCYGEFAPGSSVSYYQVEVGSWVGDPSRPAGTPALGSLPALPAAVAPTTSAPLGADLYNTAIIMHNTVPLTVSIASVKMGPFTHGGITNLYATQEARQGMPAGLLPAFPPTGAGDAVLWGFNGLKAYADFVGSGNVGAVSLTINAYDAGFGSVSLPANPDDTLTLEIDNQGFNIAKIIKLRAYQSGGTEITSLTAGDCPAYDIGTGGYVTLEVNVLDQNGHIYDYAIEVDFGHGSIESGTPSRGYRQPGPFPPAPYGAPHVATKSFVGGSDLIRYTPSHDCCYDFRLNGGKRLTRGFGQIGTTNLDFQTANIKVSS
ncbi:MAG TPA: hypothetical protein VGU66_20940 [Candidatus Elarobacter sp.]|nr:hypothetical protein [Candidatus Elarobacter sp.]